MNACAVNRQTAVLSGFVFKEKRNVNKTMICHNLYDLCVQSVAQMTQHFDPYLTSDCLKCLPTNVLFDVLNKMCVKSNPICFQTLFKDLKIVFRFLKDIKNRRNQFHKLFQKVQDFDPQIVNALIDNYSACCEVNKDTSFEFKLKLGLILGTFFTESGSFSQSQQILSQAIRLHDNEVTTVESERHLNILLELKYKLLTSFNMMSSFDQSRALIAEIIAMIETYDVITVRANHFNLPQIYSQFAHFFFSQSLYDLSNEWSMRALQQLDTLSPTLTTIDVLRVAAKTAVVKREFKRAELLISQAMIVCKETFGVSLDSSHGNNKYHIHNIHLKLSDVFLDYGFYLLNVDLISHSVALYEMALQIRQHVFGATETDAANLLLAMTHEELGYASYVHEYASGNFSTASYHANKAMTIATQLLPEKHLLLSSVKRVKALILEEIAIDHHDIIEQERMLEQAQQLHLSALNMAREAFGEMNVQTAKHYGNLGRLYQSMKRFFEAEKMHLKAIEIKEELLGCDDYEVALSLGHLASLYNYDMNVFEKAEELYLRSIQIGIKLFGVGYSGLEYDYRGLCRVYHMMNRTDQFNVFANKLHEWKHLRDSIAITVKDSPPIKGLDTTERLSPKQIIQKLTEL